MSNLVDAIDAPPSPAEAREQKLGGETVAAHRVLAGARIIFVFSSLELGGAERQAIHLASFLKYECGSEVEIWGFSPPGRAAELCSEQGVPFRSVRPPLQGGIVDKLIGIARFVRELRNARPNVLLPYTMGPNIICGLIWRHSGARLCVWNQRDEGRGRVGRFAEKWAIRHMPLFVSNSQHGASFLSSVMGADRKSVFVVRNGINLPPPAMPRDDWRRAHDLPQEQFVACMVANIHRFKDHNTLIRAWAIVVAKLESRGIRSTLLLAGRADETVRLLKATISELGIERAVCLLGPVSDVSSLLNAVDVGVFSSRLEGCPNAVLEYMAARLAVVATDIPGVREAIGSDGEQFLASVGDAQAIADKIIQLALDPSLRMRQARANQERVQRLFGVPRMCSETASLIAGALVRIS
jgi:glycosyltransferase involved in cell wall biosynthesis